MNLEYRKCAVFRTFLLHALRHRAEKISYDFVLMHYRSSLSAVTSSQFLGPRLTRRVPYSNHSVCPSFCLSVRPSFCLSVRQKTLTFAITLLLLKIGLSYMAIHDPYDKTFPTVP